MRTKVVNVTLSNPLRRVLASTRAQFSLFPLVPKSIQTCGQKLSKWRPDALKNLSGEGLKKTFKTCVIFSRLWGSNVDQNWAQKPHLFEVFGVPGPVWAHRALRVDSESQNGAQEVKMGGKIWSNGIKLVPIIASKKGCITQCSNMSPRGVKNSFSMLQKRGTLPSDKTRDAKYRSLSLSIVAVALLAFSLNLTMPLEGQWFWGGISEWDHVKSSFSMLQKRGTLPTAWNKRYKVSYFESEYRNCGFGCLFLKSYNATRRTGGKT